MYVVVKHLHTNMRVHLHEDEVAGEFAGQELFIGDGKYPIAILISPMERTLYIKGQVKDTTINPCQGKCFYLQLLLHHIRIRRLVFYSAENCGRWSR